MTLKVVKFNPLFIAILIFIASCNTKSSYENTGFIDKGKLNIICDSSLISIINQQIEIFTHLNDSAEVNVTYKNSTSVWDTLLYGSVNTVVICGELDIKTQKILTKKNQSYPKQHIVAYDAIALISSYNSNILDSFFTIDILKNAMKQGLKIEGININLVFDRQNAQMVTDILGETKLSLKVSALNNYNEVIDYVSKNTNTVGFIPYSLISDLESDASIEILRKVKSLTLKVTDSLKTVQYVTADQSSIADGSYPLKRPVNIVLGDSKQRLAVGFVNYMFQGQATRIFLKKGIVPRYLPEREIWIDTTGNL